MKLDALQRRSRFAKPQPEDTCVDLTDRDIALFEVIDRHGKLPTNYIYDLTKHLSKDYSRLQRRLTKLYNGYCDHPEHTRRTSSGRQYGFPRDEEGNQLWEHTCEVKHFLTRDWQQFNNAQARYQPAIYGLSALGKKVLAAHGKASLYTPERNDPFLHQFMGACVSASFELECKARGIRFISREEILLHERCPKATLKLKNPLAFPVSDPEMKTIVPDNLFGFEYPDGGFRFFAVEIDRNTETIAPRKPVKNSIAKKIRGYLDVLNRKTHTAHLGIPNLTVIFITTNHMHMEHMIEYAREALPVAYKQKFLFAAHPTFDEHWTVPRDILPVLEPYRTAGNSIDISIK